MRPELRQLLSDIYRGTGEFDAAIALWPDDDPLHLRMVATLHLANRQYLKAETTCDRILLKAPPTPDVLKIRALAAQHAGHLTEAAERWRLLSQVAPADPLPLVQLASVLRVANELNGAEEAIQSAMVLLEATQPSKFWGQPGTPHPNALGTSTAERLACALEIQSRYLVQSGSPYHPSTPAPFDEALQREWDDQRSSVLQYPAEAKFLALFMAQRGIKSLFEVGMRHGSFAHLLNKLLHLDRVGGSEFRVTPRLNQLIEDHQYRVFLGDHHSADYEAWRRDQEPYDLVFIDGGHSFNDVARDFLRERRFRPRYIAFHDVWNIACLGAKRMWDELPGKVAYYCNTDPSQFLFIANRNRNRATNYLDLQREANGYCCGIGIIELRY